jgi:hypothetical protein
MTVVPLPASPCMRVRLVYTQLDDSLASSRFYLSFTGGSASAADLNTLSTDIATAWNTDLAELVSEQFTLTEVDILDLTTDHGNSGLATVSHAGTLAGSILPDQVATNIQYKIGRRYRGGKPRMYLPPPDVTKLLDPAHLTSAFVTLCNTQVAAFFSAISALSVGSLGALAQVNLSYYSGFTNVTNSSGRTRAAPKYKAAATLDTVTGYDTHALLSSQRRRRSATTP